MYSYDAREYINVLDTENLSVSQIDDTGGDHPYDRYSFSYFICLYFLFYLYYIFYLNIILGIMYS